MNLTSRLSGALAGGTLALGLCAGAPTAAAQGCVASRLDAQSSVLGHEDEVASYGLPKGHWQTSFGYRYFRSHRHFVGSVEQDGSPGTRDRRNSKVVNNVHLPGLNLSYGLSDRLSLSADVPFLVAHRSNPPNATRPFRQHTDARGVGDVNVLGRYWLGKPTSHARQNLSVGFGFKLPTGKDDATDDVQVFNPATRALETQTRTVDQSIQPGDGGFGVIAELQGFKAVGGATLFASASYLANPKGTNGVPTFRGRPTEAIMSVADQYAARVGIAARGPFLRGLGVSLAARLEGVPVEDLIGGSSGFRRPGYSIGIEPGLSYAFKNNVVSVSVPWLVRRVRNESVSDQIVAAQTGQDAAGDAAFADYVVLVGFTRRF